MALNLADRVVEVLKGNPEQRFTALEIAAWVFKNYPEECQQKKARSMALTDDAALLQQIASEISSHRAQIHKKNSQIKETEGRPRKYYFTQLTDSAEVDRAESAPAPSAAHAASPDQIVVKEQDLYPKVIDFLSSELGVHSKRVDEKRSRNSRGPGGNAWLHPDLVGMEDLSQDWHQEIKRCARGHFDKKARLWSFEVKVLINRSNVREAFFQAVSNSSWANLGYLVASEIEGADTIKELEMLTSLHGIGLIRFDAENPPESQIMIPAKERSEIDWNIANRLAEENEDFLNYIKGMCDFYQKIDR